MFLNHSWVNPRECKDVAQFGWQELQRADYAQFVKEFFSYMEGAIEEAQQLRKIEKGEVEDKFRSLYAKGGEVK